MRTAEKHLPNIAPVFIPNMYKTNVDEYSQKDLYAVSSPIVIGPWGQPFFASYRLEPA